MRTATLFLSVVAALMILASGMAIAKNFQGNGKDNVLVGTRTADTISGSGGDDTISGKAGRDRLYGDSGADTVSGGAGPDDVFGGKGADDLFGNGGDDYLNSADNRGGDVLDCGPGFDSAVIDAVDFPPVLLGGISSRSLVAAGSDITQNCEDVTTVITNPGTGTDSGDLGNLKRNEIDGAVKAGLLAKVR